MTIDEITVGDAQVMHGADVVLLVLSGRHPGSAQFTPDDAERLADILRRQARYARETSEEK